MRPCSKEKPVSCESHPTEGKSELQEALQGGGVRCLPTHPVGLNLDILDLLAVEPVECPPRTIFEELEESRTRPRVVHGLVGHHRHGLAGCGEELVVCEAQVAVELDSAVIEY